MDARLGREPSVPGAKVQDRGRRRLRPAPVKTPELSRQREHDSFARDVLEHDGPPGERRENLVRAAWHPEPSREDERAHERKVSPRHLAQSLVSACGVRVDAELVSLTELVRRQVGVEALHATSQIRCATPVYTVAILTRPSMSRFSPSSGSGRPLDVP